MHASFPEGLHSNKQGSIEVLQGARDDLGGAGAILVDEDDDGVVGASRGSGVGCDLVGALSAAASFLRDDGKVLVLVRDKLVNNLDGLIQVPTRVISQVEHEACQALTLELVETFLDLGGRGLAKLLQSQVANFSRQNLGIHHGDLYLAALDGQLLGLVPAAAKDAQDDVGPGRPLELLGDGLDPEALRTNAIDLEHLIAGEDAHLVGRSAVDGFQDFERPLYLLVYLGPDAEIGTGHVLAEGFRVIDIHEGGEGIEAAEHSP